MTAFSDELLFVLKGTLYFSISVRRQYSRRTVRPYGQDGTSLLTLPRSSDCIRNFGRINWEQSKINALIIIRALLGLIGADLAGIYSGHVSIRTASTDFEAVTPVAGFHRWKYLEGQNKLGRYFCQKCDYRQRRYSS